VRIIWSREESIIGHHKRHPATIRAKWGATKEGTITAVEVEAVMQKTSIGISLDLYDVSW
jgi:CO/xanthine dehydrogenase Mo-binding subunit